MGRTEEFKRSSDAKWHSHYQNAAEELYPDAFHPATGKPIRTLNNDEDKKIIKRANQSARED